MSNHFSSAGSCGSSQPEPSMEPICSKCGAEFPGILELIAHQASQMHFACDQCPMSFWSHEGLLQHKRRAHRPDSNLECFGCLAHFCRAADFWRHIEDNRCKVIRHSDVAKLREKNLEFARQLELRDSRRSLEEILAMGVRDLKIEDTWASYNENKVASHEPTPVPGIPSLPGLVPPSATAHPVHYHIEDFPVLPFTHGNTKNGTQMPSNQGLGLKQHGSVLSNDKSKAPQGRARYNAVPPPESYDIPNRNTKRPIQRPSTRAMNASSTLAASGKIVDPSHPDYNAAVFHNRILEKYVCPYTRCGKKFHDAIAITQHLRAPIHTMGRLRCIHCGTFFASVSSLIAHMETTTNCTIREAEDFRTALGQATGGIMDFDARSGKFVIDHRAARAVLPQRPGLPAAAAAAAATPANSAMKGSGLRVMPHEKGKNGARGTRKW